MRMISLNSAASRGFHIMAKPTGPICNLDCKYCFYLEKEKIYPGKHDWALADEALESFISQYIAAQDIPTINFAWQGGEPTILGVEYFEKIVSLQEKYAGGKEIANAFQTNGTLLDDGWGEFLAKNNFLVGLSIDGPRDIHDEYRYDKGGGPSFDKVVRGLNFLKKHGVEFNTLTCVQDKNSRKALEVYRFLREIGSGHIQFIPIVERLGDDMAEEDLALVGPTYRGDAKVLGFSVRPLQYGKFLSEIFDEWVRNDVGKTYVQIFEIALGAWMGMNPSLCVFSKNCGDALALEHNGDVYSCDHYVYPEYHLGNVLDGDLKGLVDSVEQRKFGTDKNDTLPKYCQECEVRFVCNGDCPKHRFITTPDGDPGLSYLCEGYKYFFTYISPYMEHMATRLRARQSPASVMGFARQRDMAASGKTRPGFNDPCICGSGRKYKKCCGRTV